MKKLLLLPVMLLMAGAAYAQRVDVVYMDHHEELEDKVYLYETMKQRPLFKGTELFDGKFYTWIGKRLDNRRPLLPGTYRVAFIVDTKGKLHDVTAIAAPSAESGERLAAIVERASGWGPGTVEGLRVNTYVIYTLEYME